MRIITIGLLLTLVSTISGQRCRCVEQEENGYLFCSCKKTWKQAEAYCNHQYNGRLALVTSDAIQDTVRKLLDSNSAGDTWIGARGQVEDWGWVHANRAISYQGCYQDDPNSRDLNFDVSLGLNVTPQKCIEECKKARYKYASVQSGSLCMCGNEYGQYGFSSTCSAPCSGDFQQNCGGALSNQVYRTDALDSTGWAFGSPSSGSGNVDDKECMVYKCEDFYGWTWQNEKCERKLKYMCMFDYDNSTCIARRLIPTAETCIGFSETAEASWFVAAEDCRSKGGRLLEVLSPLSHYAIRDALKDKCWLQSMWIGATKVDWTWTSGAAVTYTKWATAMPQNEYHKCVVMSYRVSFVYEWSDQPCENTHSFVCQKPSIPVITNPPTTTTITSSTTSVTTVTTPTTSKSTPSTTPTTPTTTETTPTTTRRRPPPSKSTTTSTTITSTTSKPTREKPERTPRPTVPIVETTADSDISSTVTPTETSTSKPLPPGITEPGAPPRDRSTKKSDSGKDTPTMSPGTNGQSNGTDTTEATMQPGDQIPMYIGIALGILFFLLIVAFIIYKCRKMYRKRKEKMPPTKMENGYTNRSGFVHDGDFAYANVTHTPTKLGDINGGVVDTKRNGYNNGTPYAPTMVNNLGETPINIVPPTNVMDADKTHDDLPDNMTLTATSASSEMGHRDQSDASSVNSASSAYIGELDDQGVSVQYVHPRDEVLDQSNQPTLPRDQAYNKMADDSHSSTLYPGSNDSLIKTSLSDSTPNIESKVDLTTRL